MSKTYKTEGIVLHSLKYSETSLILDIYTREQGLGSYIVSGVRKQKSKTANIYHPMNIIDMIAYNSRENLSRIKEATYSVMYRRLDRDVIRASVGVFFVELLRNSLQAKEPDDRLYQFIRNILIQLDEKQLMIANLPIRFAIELTPYLGFHIQNNHSEETPYFDLRLGQFVSELGVEKQVLNARMSLELYRLMRNPLEHQLTKEDKHFLLDRMMDFYRLHIDNFRPLRSIPVLRTIFG